MQQEPPCPAALDNRPTHRTLRYRRGPVTSGAALLPARCDGMENSRRIPGYEGL